MKTAMIRILTLVTLATSISAFNRLNSLFPRSRLIFLQHEALTDLPVLTWPPVAD
jgi:hypothetical protein